MPKRSLISYGFSICLSLLPIIAGFYVLIEKKMMFGGRYNPGHLYEFDFPANIIMATSFFLVAALIIIALTGIKHKNKIIEGLILTAFVLFIIAVFL